jgi:hypothetical protein
MVRTKFIKYFREKPSRRRKRIRQREKKRIREETEPQKC